MRERTHGSAEQLPSGITAEMDGSRWRRNLDPVEVALYASLIPIAAGSLVLSIAINQRVSPRTVAKGIIDAFRPSKTNNKEGQYPLAK